MIPLMLWKPYAPIYPKLVKNVAEGLTFEETKELRNRGLNSAPLMKLSEYRFGFRMKCLFFFSYIINDSLHIQQGTGCTITWWTG